MSKLRKIVRTTFLSRKREDAIELARDERAKFCGRDKRYAECYGMHVLNSERIECGVDIIAVHGLGGHAFRSWTHEPSEKMWLRDFLPQQVPRARVATFGYDARVAKSRGVVELLDSAQSLLLDIKQLRCTLEEQERPLVLIGHSLGGIIIKKALVMAQQQIDSYSVLEKTCCVVFMGVPHLGASIVNTVEALVGIAQIFGDFNTRHLEDLKKESPSLRDLAQAFGQLEGFKIVTVTEGLETAIPGIGKSVHVVPQTSASLNIGSRETIIPIDGADHHMICKFGDSEDCQYGRVWKSINQYLAEWESKHRIRINGPPTPPLNYVPALRTGGFPLAESPIPSPSGYTSPISPERAGELSLMGRGGNPTPPIELEELISRSSRLFSSHNDSPPLRLLRQPTYSLSLSRSSTLPLTSSPNHRTLTRTATDLTPTHDAPQILHKAVQEGNTALVKYILEQTHGLHVNVPNAQGRGLLSNAAGAGEKELVKLLLHWGADVNARDDMGRTALHRAAGFGMVGVVKILLEKGANREVRDVVGRTALEWADKEEVRELMMSEWSEED